MTAVGCFVGTSMIAEVMMATVIIGALFGVFVAVSRGQLGKTVSNTILLVQHHQRQGLEPHPELNLANAKTLQLPYALPIMAGGFVSAWTLATRCQTLNPPPLTPRSRSPLLIAGRCPSFTTLSNSGDRAPHA